jgi:hypothetical protein
MEIYCGCELPIKMVRNTSESYKFWRCAKCGEKVSPLSKMINKHIDNVDLFDATSNERILEHKINEIIELIRANGGMS